MNITTYIPESVLSILLSSRWASTRADPSAVRQAVTELVQVALAGGYQPLAPPPKAASEGEAAVKVRVTLYFPLGPASAINAFARKLDCPQADVVRRLLAALAADGEYRPPAPSESHPVIELSRARGQESRAEQALFYDHLAEALSQGVIGLVEAGTGIGKTRAELLAAANFARRTGQTVCIAVPTLALLRQGLDEYSMQREWDATLPRLRPIRGRREFFSESALDEVRSGPDLVLSDRAAFDAWIKNASHPWLVDELEAVAPDFPLDMVRLGDMVEEDDPGYLAYRAQFGRGTPRDVSKKTSGQLLLCTHAMLAQDARRKLQHIGRDDTFQAIQSDLIGAMKTVAKTKGSARHTESSDRLRATLTERRVVVAGLSEGEDIGILPPYSALIVDEAHLLEPTFSSQLGDYVSLRAMVKNLWEFRETGSGGLTVAYINEIEGLVQRIADCGTPGAFLPLESGLEERRIPDLVHALHLLLRKLQVKRPPKDKKRLLHYLEHQRATTVIGSALKHSGKNGYITYSQVRNYPQIYLGPRSVEMTLQILWGSVRAGAVVSATLYTENAAGGYSSSYQRALLGIELARAREYKPLYVAWTRTPVTVHVHDGSDPDWLRRPSTTRASARRDALWLDAVAVALQSIHRNAVGGVLALLTSYDIAAGLQQRLSHLGDALVAARDKLPLRLQHRDFYRAVDAGHKPLWLALGGAWTGIDVGGHSDLWKEMHQGAEVLAVDDQVLTDLVIPALPYGVNQSLTFRWRLRNRPEFPWQSLDAAFMNKQGIGRLIRRPGLQDNRHLWLLDARLGDPNAHIERALFLNYLKSYPHRVPLALPKASSS